MKQVDLYTQDKTIRFTIALKNEKMRLIRRFYSDLGCTFKTHYKENMFILSKEPMKLAPRITASVGQLSNGLHINLTKDYIS